MNATDSLEKFKAEYQHLSNECNSIECELEINHNINIETILKAENYE